MYLRPPRLVPPPALFLNNTSGKYYQWQRWTGPVWERPSVGAHWDEYNGHSYNLIGGWGPFEMIDYAVALGAGAYCI